MTTPAPKKQIPAWANFVIGGLSGMGSTCVVQPVDLVKTRMQLTAGAGAKESAFSIAAKVIRSEGVLAMYNG